MMPKLFKKFDIKSLEIIYDTYSYKIRRKCLQDDANLKLEEFNAKRYIIDENIIMLVPIVANFRKFALIL